MHWLKQRGFRTVFLDDLRRYRMGQRSLQGREIALTFDDGFLDNWVFVWPLAQKLGLRFTVFVSPEFVDPRDIVRPNLSDLWAGRVAWEDLEWWGFLSWPEMRLMEESGLVDIQSHALTHTCYPSEAKVIDFHHPGDSYFWLIWNSYPETKPHWLAQYDETLLDYGTPVYAFKPSLTACRYRPDPGLDRSLAACVESRGGARFFDSPAWRKVLFRELGRQRREKGDRGRFETGLEHEARVRYEIAESKHRIEKALRKSVEFLCWPGGGETPLARRLALETGYKATTKGRSLNRPGTDPTRIHRVSAWFNAPIAMGLKWRLFRGQIDRGSGRWSASALLAALLSRTRRLVTGCLPGD